MDRGLFPDPVCFPIHILHLFYTPTWGLERHSPEAMLVQRTLHRDRWIAVTTSARSTFYIYFTRQRGDLRGTLQKRCWSSGRCTEIGGSRSVSRSSLFPDPHFTFILHANMGSRASRSDAAADGCPRCVRKHICYLDQSDSRPHFHFVDSPTFTLKASRERAVHVRSKKNRRVV